MTKVDIMR